MVRRFGPELGALYYEKVRVRVRVIALYYEKVRCAFSFALTYSPSPPLTSPLPPLQSNAWEAAIKAGRASENDLQVAERRDAELERALGAAAGGGDHEKKDR